MYVPTSTDRRRTVAELIDATIRDHLPTKRHNKSADKVRCISAGGATRSAN
ncbi:MAG TPA: hypothetical protein VF422_04175 [Dokdonella sp.]